MNGLLRRAEEILNVAVSNGQSEPSVIVFDRMGGMRMLDPTGWSLAGLIREFGASEIYRIERRNGAVRVEGWSEAEKCLLERKTPRASLPGLHAFHASMLQAVPMLAV